MSTRKKVKRTKKIKDLNPQQIPTQAKTPSVCPSAKPVIPTIHGTKSKEKKKKK